MDQHIAFFFAVIAVFIVIACVIISWYNFRLKKRIIESGPINDEAMGFIKKLGGPSVDALKWGCILFAAGLGLVVANYLPCPFGSPVPYGVELMFIAAGFLAYYFIAKNQKQQQS
jgi:cbb3-type cytochrome oxidase subunit 3